MFDLLTFALIHLAILVGSPKTASTASRPATQTTLATSTTAAPAPTNVIGNEGWDNDITAHH